MSVIHEALKRAERERSAGTAAGAAPPGVAPAMLPRGRHRLWIGAVLAATILLAAGLFFTSRGDHPRAVPSSPGMVTAVLPPSPSPPSQPVPLRPVAPAAPVSAPPVAPGDGVAPATDADPARLNSQAVAAFRDGRPEAARSLLEQALRLAPALPEAHNNLGMVLQSLGRGSAAREEYLRALALFPGYPEALNNLGLAWSGEGNQGEAIRSFERALAVKPGYSSAHLNLAIVYDKLGKKSDAFYHYRRFLDNAGSGEQELVRRVNDRLRR